MIEGSAAWRGLDLGRSGDFAHQLTDAEIVEIDAAVAAIGEWLDAALPKFITEGLNVQFFFGGTSLLIVVGVAMDTVQQVESQLIMRHYDGFMKRSRIRGRRA